MPVITNPYRHAAAGVGLASRYFDGSSYVEISRPATVDGSGFAVALWAKWTTTGTSFSTIQALVDNNHTTGQGWVLQDRPDSSKKTSGSVIATSGTFPTVLSVDQVGDGTWKHLVLNWDGSTLELFVNGSSVGSVTQTITTNFQTTITVGATEVDHTAFGGGNRFLTGHIADLRFYDDPLSAADCAALYGGTSVETGLVGWYFTNADDVLDYSGNGNNGTNNGSTYLPSGPFGVTPALPTFGNASREFESSETDYISITTGASNGFGSLVGSGNGITLAAWVKLESGGTRQVVLGDWNTGGTGDSCVLEINSSNKVQLYIRPGGQYTDFQSSGTLNIGQWHHVAVCYYYGSGVSVFLDGVETVGPARSGDISLGTGISIGKAGEAAGLYFDGLIADVRFYNRGLSAAEISSIISGTHITTGLVGWWLTDEFNYTDVIVDYSGNGNNGTNNGSTYSIIGPKDNLVLDLDAGNSASYSGTGTTWSDLSDYSNSGTLVNGVGYSSDDGGSLVFDGVDDYFNISSAIEETANTISIWVNMQSTDPCPIVYYGDDAFTSFSWTWGIAVYPSGTHGFNERPLGYPTNDLYAENVELNVWKNFVLVRDDNGDAKVYKNGSLVGTKLNGGTTSLRSTSDRLFIGKAGSTYGNFLLSKVSIYNKALSELEIQQNFELYRGRYGI